MPQYNAPSAITELAEDDIVLVWQTSSAANKTISFSDLVASAALFLPHVDSVAIVSSNVVLNGSYQFIVGNSPAAIEITLPSATAFPGRRFRIGNKGAGEISVITSGSDVIMDGSFSTSSAITQYQAFDFESDGVGAWFRVG